MKRRILVAGLLSVCLGGCNTAPASPLPTTTGQPLIVATLTPTTTRIPTATPVQLTLRVVDRLVNCRYGPGLVYELMDELAEGQSARVLGRNGASTWWYIRDPGNPNGFCWVSSSVTEISGDAGSLPVIQAPATRVTGLRLVVEPNRIVVDCSRFPQTFFFEAQIDANGPLLANWQWEASTGVISDLRTLIFDEAGTQVINEYYQVGGPNDYWVKLHILSPNEISDQVNFRASCPP